MWHVLKCFVTATEQRAWFAPLRDLGLVLHVIHYTCPRRIYAHNCLLFKHFTAAVKAIMAGSMIWIHRIHPATPNKLEWLAKWAERSTRTRNADHDLGWTGSKLIQVTGTPRTTVEMKGNKNMAESFPDHTSLNFKATMLSPNWDSSFLKRLPASIMVV